MKKFYILTTFLFIGNFIFAQSETDIVRYSITTSPGTARSAAMGGAFGALGGDLSSFSTNPAGIGVFRKSEVSFTPYLNISKTKSGNRTINDPSFQLGSMGGVVALYNKNSDWKGINFGFNYTNLNNFNQKTNQFIYDSPTSHTQVWANEANLALDRGWSIPDRSIMANNVYLIQYMTPEGESPFYDPTLYPREETVQQQYIREEGYQGEYDFSFGTNYKDKLYLGVTIGIQSIRYKYKSIFTGKGSHDNFYGLDKYDFGRYLTTNGVGTNFKFGVIYRPVPVLRIGAAIHTPTYFSITDNYTEDMHSVFFEKDEDGYNIYDSFLENTSYDYDMQTPWKAIFSLATVLNQKTIISVDYEFNNYNSSKFSGGDQDFYNPEGTGPNDYVKALLKNTHNLRIGAEYRFNSLFSLRGGYAYWDSPYKYNKSLKTQSVSGGLGFNFGSFYCDAAYIYKFSKNTTHFYEYLDPDDAIYDVIAEPIDNKYMAHQGRITLGVRF